MGETMTHLRVSIHEGIPLPKKEHKAAYKYPFGSLKEGSMFLIECPANDRQRVMRSVVVAAHSWCKRRGFQNMFTCRTLANGVGIFRLKEEAAPETSDGHDND
jgi:hypothetical protein